MWKFFQVFQGREKNGGGGGVYCCTQPVISTIKRVIPSICEIIGA